MTLDQIDTKLREAESHNTKLTERKQMYAERLKKEFGVESVDELRTMLANTEKQLGEKNSEYENLLAQAEAMLKAAGVTC